jgi:hypothetical protein
MQQSHNLPRNPKKKNCDVKNMSVMNDTMKTRSSGLLFSNLFSILNLIYFQTATNKYYSILIYSIIESSVFVSHRLGNKKNFFPC